MKFRNKLILGAIMLLAFIVPNINSNKAYAGTYPSVSNLKETDFTTSSITVTWTGENCTSYEVFYRDYYSSDFKSAGKTTATTMTIKGLKGGAQYTIKVVGSNPSVSYTHYASIYDAVTKIVTPSLKQDTWWHFIEKADVSWANQLAASEYNIIWYNASGKKITSRTVKRNSSQRMTDSLNIKNNQIYLVKVRAKQKLPSGKTYTTSFRTIKVFEQPWLTSKSKLVKTSSSKYLYINWPKQKGATGYEVFVSTDNKTYKRAKKVKAGVNTVKITKFNKKPLKKSTYYVYVISKTTLNGKTNRSGLVYTFKVTTSGNSYTYCR